MNHPQMGHERLMEKLRAVMVGTKSAVVALSGGVDSSLVALVAREVLGRDRVLAVTGESHSLATAERDAIVELCAEHDIPHHVVTTHELSLEAYRKNDPDRCFHCKNELYGTLRRLADAEGYLAVFDGTHAADLGAHRPSLRAAKAHNVTSPLVAAGFEKDEIRLLATGLGLSNAQRPAQPCLSSRIAYGLPVDEQRLAMVEQSEAALRALGFETLRVRHHDTIARIEVPAAALARVLDLRLQIDAALRDAGFTYVTLDLRGLRSGSLLEVLNHRPDGRAS